jgi:hypothetical protein
MSYSGSVDHPELETKSGHDVCVDYGVGGGSYVDKSNGDVLATSDTHTKFSGYDHSDHGSSIDDDGSLLDGIVDAVDSAMDNCTLM